MVGFAVFVCDSVVCNLIQSCGLGQLRLVLIAFVAVVGFDM